MVRSASDSFLAPDGERVGLPREASAEWGRGVVGPRPAKPKRSGDLTNAAKRRLIFA